MRKRTFICLVIAVFLLSAAPFLWRATLVMSQSPSPPPQHVAPPLRAPDDHQPTPVVVTSEVQPQTSGLKAIAIVGEVGDHTQSYKDDMQVAVDALEDHGVAVHKFFYGESSFTWGDIVDAAGGVHFLLYMGHGIYWGGSCANPTEVGGFYLGNGQYVSSDQIRNDLGGKIAEDSVVIFSHACFSAGDTACDPDGSLTQTEAERRVKMYAAPFVDIGMKAYYANNWFDSSRNLIYQLLADPDGRKNAGDIFKSTYPFSTLYFRDLTYPISGYDLWLSGYTGYWSYAFVGIPGYVFANELPELGALPETLTFEYNQASGQLTPLDATMTLTNVATSDPLQWTVSGGASWFNIDPTTGQTPDDALAITPNANAVAALPEGEHTGAFTVTVTDPADTLNAVQRVDVILDVVTPRLGNLPADLNFTYFVSDTQMLPQTHVVMPRNVGSDDVLTWDLEQAGTWFEMSTVSGATPDTFTLTPTSYTTTQPMTYTGCVTVTVTAPIGTDDAVQRIDLTLRVKAASPEHVFLPLITRD